MKTDNTKGEKKNIILCCYFVLGIILMIYTRMYVAFSILIYILIGTAITRTEGLKFWQKCICWTAYPILIPFVETRIFFKRFWSKNNG